MIKRNEMIPLLLKECPSFAPKWSEFTEEWKEEVELPYYLCLTTFSRHLISKMAKDHTSNFDKIFDTIERLILEGDSYVKEAIIVGLLEDMQNGNLHKSTKPEEFRPYLKQESERWWNKLYDFWDKGKLLTDD